MPKNQSPTKTTQKYNVFLKITTWILTILLFIYGILIPLISGNNDKSASDLWNNILIPAIILLTIIYVCLAVMIHLKSTPKFTQASLKYTILPAGAITVIISYFNAKFFNDYPSFASSILAILGALFPAGTERSQLSIRKERKKRTEKSINNLNSESHHLRVEAIQNLALIADEWLGDDFAGESTSKTETQNILDQLCLLVRSEFPLLEEQPCNDVLNITQGKQIIQLIQQEQEVRRLVFTEISKRLGKINQEGGTTEGTWDKFDFDFSWAPIFYKMNGLTLKHLDFNKLKFYGDIDFSKSTFITPITCSSIFTTNINFKGAKFCSDICFTDSFFYGLTDFSNTAFYGKADFEITHFGDSSLNEPKMSKYWEEYLEELVEIFTVKDIEPLNIPDGTLQAAPANFKNAVFYKEAFFCGAKFHKDAHFECTKFKNIADFTGALFKGQPCFDKAIFDGAAIFLDVEPRSEIYFKHTMFNENEARNNKFLSHGYPQNIKKGIVPTDPSHNWPSEYNIPIDSCYFRNFSDCEEAKIYYCSAPAKPIKPIKESDNPGETPSK